MKSIRKLKRKISDVSRKQDEFSCLSVKKPANGNGQLHNKDNKVFQLKPKTPLLAPAAKIKLQLFPINESTRMGLEKDGHNPYLELTLSPRKKISSVVRHLNAKWSGSTVAIGELLLFPYNVKLEKIHVCKRWTLYDAATTAGDVYVVVGSASPFCLRYGWFSTTHRGVLEMPPLSGAFEANMESDGKISGCTGVLDIMNNQGKPSGASENFQCPVTTNEVSDSLVKEVETNDAISNCMYDGAGSDIGVRSSILWDDNLTNLSIGGLLSEISLQGKINGTDLNSLNKPDRPPIGLHSDTSVGGLLSEISLQGKINYPDMKLESESTVQPFFLTSSDISVGGLLNEASLLSEKTKLNSQETEKMHAQFQSTWDGCLTNLSIGGLLSDISLLGKDGCNPVIRETESNLNPNAPPPDTLDAFINAQLHAHHPHAAKPSCDKSTSSILDAEETCHAFPIQKFQPSSSCAINSNSRACSGGCTDDNSKERSWFTNITKVSNEAVFAKDSSCQELNPLHPSQFFH